MARRPSDIGPRIVEAARERFLREGVDGASLRAIAADAGTSIGMVYYYFPTKDELFFAVVEDVYAALLADLAQACAPDVAPADRVRRLYRRIGAISERESEVVRLVIREVLVSSKRLRRLFGRFQRGHIPIVLATIMDGVADRSIRDDLPPFLMLVVAIAVGVIPQFVIPQVAPQLKLDGKKGDALADVLVDLLWNGISGARSRSGSSSPGARRGGRARR